MHVKQIIETERKYISVLGSKRLEGIDFSEILRDTQVALGKAISHLFFSLAGFLGPTGASKTLHSLFPQLVVMWDTQIRVDYGVEADADSFLEFQKISRMLLDDSSDDFAREHGTDQSATLQEISRLTYGDSPKSLPKLIDEFNWATRGESKCHPLR